MLDGAYQKDTLYRYILYCELFILV